MKKPLKLFALSAGFLLLVTADLFWVLIQFAPTDTGEPRTQSDMSPLEQAELLQMFFPDKLPKPLHDVRIQALMPTMGDGEVRASFRVSPQQAKKLAAKLQATGDAGSYTSAAFQSARGSIHIYPDSGRVVIEWSEY